MSGGGADLPGEPRQAAPVTTLAWEWQATGTVWRIHHDGAVDAGLAEAVADAVEQDEERWSRFRSTSEVTRINAAAGLPVAVSPETVELIGACISFRRRSGGVFEPLVRSALVAWGYERGMQDEPPYSTASPPGQAVRGPITLDRRRGTVTIPAGAHLDLGGIGKGWIADRAAALLADAHPDGPILVDAGGDLVAARGSHLIAVEGEPRTWILLRESSAVATSGWGRRSWRNGDGRPAHHLIDPATGAPGRLASATVVAPTCAEADVFAKTVALRPHDLESVDVPARVHSDGACASNPAWNALIASPMRP